MSSFASEVEFLGRLERIRDQLARQDGALPPARRASGLLGRLARSLERPARVVICGEVNSGKSSLANRLIGSDLLHTDAVGNTRAPLHLKYSTNQVIEIQAADGRRRRVDGASGTSQRLDAQDTVLVGLPIEILRDVEIVDTPGASLGAGLERLHGLCTRADMVIWCTVATQAWRASEVASWRKLRAACKQRGLLVATHADLISATDREKVASRLKREAGPLFSRIIMSLGSDTARAERPDPCLSEILTAVREARAQKCQRAAAIVDRFAGRIEEGLLAAGQPIEFIAREPAAKAAPGPKIQPAPKRDSAVAAV